MGLIEALTPRGARPRAALTLQLDKLQAGDSAQDVGAAPTPRTMSRLSKLRQLTTKMLTPRGRSGGSQQQLPPDDECGSPASSGALIKAYRPTLTGLMESRTLARTAAAGAAAAAGGAAAATTPAGLTTAAPSGASTDASSDTASEAGSNDSELSSLDGFGDYARGLEVTPARTDEGAGSTASCPPADPDRLP